jgi:hypothetical protein
MDSMSRSFARLSYSGSLFLLIALALVVPAPVDAVAIRVNTGNVDKPLGRGAPDPSVTWNYTGDFDDARFVSYVDNDPVFPGPTTVVTCHFVSGNCRTSNNSQYGSDVPVPYPAYRGVQFFYLTFELPAPAMAIALDISVVGADDRIGLGLNGHEIGFWGNVNGTGFGRMDGSDIYAGTSIGPGVEPTRTSGVFFQNPFGFPGLVLTDPSQFLVGQTNVLRLWVNNTGFRSFTNSARPMSSGDPSVAAFDATVNFTLAQVPEPSTLLLLSLGFVGLGYSGRRAA